MTTPNLIVTTLGAVGSVRSTFLLGMYNVLSAGVHGYFVLTEDPNQDLDLRDAWDLLIDKGRLPSSTAADSNYRLVFGHEFTPLLTIDWMDYRGGALDDRRDSGSNAIELRARLERSDSIYLILDAGSLHCGWTTRPSGS